MASSLMNTIQIANPDAIRELAMKTQQLGDGQKQLVQTQDMIRDHITRTKNEQLTFTANYVEEKVYENNEMTHRFFQNTHHSMTS